MRLLNTFHNAQNQNSNFTSHHNIVLNMANKEYKESLKNLEKFKHKVLKFKNYLTAYESFYHNLAKPYFLRISHDKEIPNLMNPLQTSYHHPLQINLANLLLCHGLFRNQIDPYPLELSKQTKNRNSRFFYLTFGIY